MLDVSTRIDLGRIVLFVIIALFVNIAVAMQPDTQRFVYHYSHNLKNRSYLERLLAYEYVRAGCYLRADALNVTPLLH